MSCSEDYKALYPVNLLDELKAMHFKTNKKRTYESMPKFVFLCGKKEDSQSESNRTKMINYLRTKCNACFLLAEELWWPTDTNLLVYEQYMAEVSDSIILFLESFGTAAELGAFSSNPQLCAKMITILDEQYHNDKSFINNGPVENILRCSRKQSIFYVNPARVLEDDPCINFIYNDVNRAKSLCVNQDYKAVIIAAYILELLDIIKMVGPIHKDDVIEIYKIIKGFSRFDFHEKKFQHKYAVDILIKTELVRINDHSYLMANKSTNLDNLFMFDATANKANSLHLRFYKQKQNQLDQGIYMPKEGACIAN